MRRTRSTIAAAAGYAGLSAPIIKPDMTIVDVKAPNGDDIEMISLAPAQ